MQDSILDTWEGDDFYCRNVTQLAINGGPPVTDGEACDIQCDAPVNIYLAALYWAVMTVTTVGSRGVRLGDTPRVVLSHRERSIRRVG